MDSRDMGEEIGVFNEENKGSGVTAAGNREIEEVIAYLMVTSVAAQGEFLYLAYNGDREVSWSQGCASYGKFCNRVKLALILHVIAVCCFLVLAVISAHRVFRTFQPPFLHSKQPQQQMT